MERLQLGPDDHVLAVVAHPDDMEYGSSPDACARVGVDNLTILDFPDGLLTYSLELREAICAHIRRLRPTVILTQDWAEVAPWGLNQADHRVAGLAAVDAARDAGNEFLSPGQGRNIRPACF